MRMVSISELESGDILAKAVEGKGGIVMLEAGTILTEQYITRLKTLRVKTVQLDKSINRAAADGLESNVTRKADLTWIRPDIDLLKENDKVRGEAVERANVFAEMEFKQEQIVLPIAGDKFRDQFRDIVKEITSQRVFAEELGVMMLTDRLLFDQAMHVTLCSNLLGAAQGYDTAKLYELTIGAMFCDIGMTRLPTDLTKVNRVLTEEEIQLMRQHTNEGYRILKSLKEVPLSAAQCALLHHERYRGSGYPLAMSHLGIPEFAQIVGIADVYHALMSPRHHRNSYDPGEAIEYLFASGNYDFEISLVQVFLRHLTIYPVSTVVRLSNGQVGRVVETTGRPIQRPAIEVFREANGLAVMEPYLLELQKQPNVVIVGKADK
jgi:HD-GYP domain-containing protein (c-di-GMP phosphodiesterase class II)